ncbi:METTL21B [Symbiodinium pilosum]|uniref:METTL21B protein n=1 Tax=Symbiodinium pilosum TaxID=2952 RepID=A0A812Y7W2_SYMPI|nr:METTL21B [Symbiodinium pilosum]
MPKVVARLMRIQENRTGTSPIALYCQTLHRWGFAGYDVPFLEGCVAADLVPEALWLEGAGFCTGHVERDRVAVEVDKTVPTLAQRPAVFRLVQRKSDYVVEPVADAWLRYAVRWREERDKEATGNMDTAEREEVEASERFAAVLEGQLL